MRFNFFSEIARNLISKSFIHKFNKIFFTYLSHHKEFHVLNFKLEVLKLGTLKSLGDVVQDEAAFISPLIPLPGTEVPTVRVRH